MLFKKIELNPPSKESNLGVAQDVEQCDCETSTHLLSQINTYKFSSASRLHIY